MTQPIEQKPEPRQAPMWMAWVGAVLMFVGFATVRMWLVMTAAVPAVWWLVQHFRWVSWDADRRAAQTRGSHDEH